MYVPDPPKDSEPEKDDKIEPTGENLPADSSKGKRSETRHIFMHVDPDNPDKEAIQKFSDALNALMEEAKKEEKDISKGDKSE